jgi:hypothetical protein
MSATGQTPRRFQRLPQPERAPFAAIAGLLVARLGLQQSLRPLQIPSPIDIAGHPRCLALYPHRILKIYLAPKHAIEAAQLFCLLNDVVDFWSRHVKLLE